MAIVACGFTSEGRRTQSPSGEFSHGSPKFGGFHALNHVASLSGISYIIRFLGIDVRNDFTVVPWNAYSVRMLGWVTSAWKFNARTLWPTLKMAVTLILTVASVFGVLVSFFSHAQHGEWLAWSSTLALAAVVVVLFHELHKRQGHGEGEGEGEEAQGLRELDLLKTARDIVRVVLTRNDGNNDFVRNAHWTMWANDLEKIVEQSSMDLSFLELLPDQWRRKHIDDDSLQSADKQLSGLIKKRSHFGFTKLALQNPVRRPI